MKPKHINPLRPSGLSGGRPIGEDSRPRSPDWSFWLAMKDVSIVEAAALTLDIDPDAISGDDKRRPSWADWDGAEEWRKRIRVIKSHCYDNEDARVSLAALVAALPFTDLPDQLQRLVNDAPGIQAAPEKVGADGTAKAKGGRKQGPARELLIRILDELENWATAAGEPFDRRRMPGQVGEGPDDKPGFHWFCAEIDGHVFRRAKATFEKHREGLCTFAGWAKPSNFYHRALPHIAPKIASGNKAAKLPARKRKAA